MVKIIGKDLIIINECQNDAQNHKFFAMSQPQQSDILYTVQCTVYSTVIKIGGKDSTLIHCALCSVHHRVVHGITVIIIIKFPASPGVHHATGGSADTVYRDNTIFKTSK